ncbi:MAG: helix-turn-helix domain-containing protein [Betaproteobacteria bacterium]|nr:helix-turn-helix domain-containing protein [Betaproteobacteria bacterium]
MKTIVNAIALLGGPSKAAATLNVTIQAVCFWRDGKRRLPAERCPAIERATGGAVTCEELRPDVDWAYLRGTAPSAEPPKEAA